MDPKAKPPRTVIRDDDEPKGEPPAPTPVKACWWWQFVGCRDLMSPAFATDAEKWALDLVFEGCSVGRRTRARVSITSRPWRANCRESHRSAGRFRSATLAGREPKEATSDP